MTQVLVLLSTFNGENFLKQQLESLQNQTFKDFLVLARDDGSSDGTTAILHSYDVKIVESSTNIGVVPSFASIAKYAFDNYDTEYFMFCDQDDVWLPHKIQISLEQIQITENKQEQIPLLFHSDLEVVDSDLNTISKSFVDYQKINPNKNKLNNLLLQNVVTGCTTIFNRALLEKALPIPNNVIVHDWWFALVASQFGKIHYIDQVTIKYRQHSNNDTGAKAFSYWGIIKKAFSLFTHKFIFEHNINLAEAFLRVHENELDGRTKKILVDLSTIKLRPYFTRRFILIRYRLLKQGFIRNLGLFLKI